MSDLEREALEAAVAYREAQIESDIHVYGSTPPPASPPRHSEGELLNLYVASRVAIDKVIDARRAAPSPAVKE